MRELGRTVKPGVFVVITECVPYTQTPKCARTKVSALLREVGQKLFVEPPDLKEVILELRRRQARAGDVVHGIQLSRGRTPASSHRKSFRVLAVSESIGAQ